MVETNSLSKVMKKTTQSTLRAKTEKMKQTKILKEFEKKKVIKSYLCYIVITFPQTETTLSKQNKISKILKNVLFLFQVF